MTTLGFSVPTDVIRCSRIIFKGHIESRGWTGPMVRNSVESEDALLEIDLRWRLVRASPRNGRQPFECPLENVQQYFREEPCQNATSKQQAAQSPRLQRKEARGHTATFTDAPNVGVHGETP